MWLVHKANEHCMVAQVLPMDGDAVQRGHLEGMTCPCMPCLTDDAPDDGVEALIHHRLVDGKPARCTEPGSHKCSLRDADV